MRVPQEPDRRPPQGRKREERLPTAPPIDKHDASGNSGGIQRLHYRRQEDRIQTHPARPAAAVTTWPRMEHGSNTDIQKSHLSVLHRCFIRGFLTQICMLNGAQRTWL